MQVFICFDFLLSTLNSSYTQENVRADRATGLIFVFLLNALQVNSSV